MKCRLIRKKISEYFDAGSPETLPVELADHLKSCPDCTNYYDQVKRTMEKLHPMKQVRATPNLKERIMSEILQHQLLEQKQTIRSNRSFWYLKPVVATSFALLILLSILALDVLLPNQHPQNNSTDSTAFSLLSQAWANEQALFDSEGILHLINEILVPPIHDAQLAKARWFPLSALKADGGAHNHQLALPSEPGKGYTIHDEAWYDPAEHKFIRILSKKDKAFFATAFDGENIYDIDTDKEGRINQHPVSEAFKSPEKPENFLGVFPGFASQIMENDKTQFEFLEDATLENGVDVRVLQAVNPMPGSKVENAILFKIKQSDSTIAEIEWRINGSSYLIIRRKTTETVEMPRLPWNLDGIEILDNATASQPHIRKDMILMDVSVKHMVSRADFEAYVLSPQPAWTEKGIITDILDVANSPKRMFSITYRAADGRHVVIIQSEMYNKMMGNFTKNGKLVYKSTNGFKVWSTAMDKMGAMIALQSARATIGDAPSEHRTGYILESPSGTFPAIAINGKLTDDELHSLIDSFIAAKDYTE